MQYRSSIHFRENPHDEIEAALTAGNTIDSIQITLESRLMTEMKRKPCDIEAKQRIEQQLAHVSMMTADMVTAA